MKFGIMLTPHWPENCSQAKVYADAVGYMVAAEQLGYWSGWTTEHHFGSDLSYRPYGLDQKFPAYDLNCDPLTFLAYVAAKTHRLRLGTGVLVLHYDHPLRVAERAAMLDILSNGRLELGLGRGGGYREPVAFNVPHDETENQDKFFEGIDILRMAWTGRSFSYKGKFFDIPEVTVVPSPSQTQIPVFLSNRNPRSLKYAASNGMSYVAVTASWGTAGIDRHNEGHVLFEKTAIDTKRDVHGVTYPHTLFCYVAPTDQEAEEVAEHYLTIFAGYGESHYEYARRAAKSSPAPLSPSGQGGENQFAARFKAQLETNLIGSPNTVAEKLTALRNKIPSLNYVLAITGAGAPPKEFVTRSMKLFAEKVMPKFSNASEIETRALVHPQDVA